MSITEQHSPGDVVAASDPGPTIRRPMYATQLRKARTEHGLSVGDVSSRTKVRPGIIEALENGDVEPSGGIVYARGHVRSLAHALGLDPVPLVASFDHAHRDQVSQVPVLSADIDVPEIVGRPRRARRTSGDGERRSRWPLLLAVVLVVVIAIALVQLLVPGSTSKDTKRPSAQPAPSASSPASTPTPPRAKPVATLPPMVFPVPAQGVVVRMVLPFLPSWISVSDQNGVPLLPTGVQPSSYKAIDLKATNGMRITVGDASAVALSCNGKPLPRPLGGPNQVMTLDLYRGNAFCPAS